MTRKIFFVLYASLILHLTVFPGGLNLVTTYPYIGGVAREIGGENVNISILAKGEWDPHTIVPKPSFIAKLRSADLLIINGAQLEIGWLPALLRQANNPKIQTGDKGFLDLSRHVTLIGSQSSVSRAHGDIHPEGNPHFYMDYDNINKIASAVTARLSELDPENKPYYENNKKDFLVRFDNKKKEWQDKLKPLRGMKVIEYHKLFDYLIGRIGFELVGTIEPLPGISPTARHIGELGELIKSNGVKFILQDVYHPEDASVHLAKKYGMKMIVVPHDLGAVKNSDDIFSFYDEIVRRFTND